MDRSQQTSEQGGNSRPFRAQLAPPTRSAPLVGGKVVRRLRARGVRAKEEGTPEVTGQESPPPELSTLVLFRVKSGVNTGPQPPPLLRQVWLDTESLFAVRHSAHHRACPRRWPAGTSAQPGPDRSRVLHSWLGNHRKAWACVQTSRPHVISSRASESRVASHLLVPGALRLHLGSRNSNWRAVGHKARSAKDSGSFSGNLRGI